MAMAVNLYEAKKNSILQVTSIPNVRLLQSLGLRCGTQIIIQGRYSFGGPVVLRVEDTYSIAIGKDIATQIAVKQVDLL